MLPKQFQRIKSVKILTQFWKPAFLPKATILENKQQANDYKLVSLVNTNSKYLNKMLVHQIQQTAHQKDNVSSWGH